uniref:Uncharacterized protein n=1 Tax=Romanomermis culicivorax TaxID=13658 RepID=A0A915JQ69_ROMCU
MHLQMEQKPAGFNPDMLNQKSNTQPSSSTQSDKTWRLKQKMGRLTANIAKLMAEQQSPAP